MLGVTVEVEAYVPYLEYDELLKSINLGGLPRGLVKEIAEVTLNDLKGNAEMKPNKKCIHLSIGIHLSEQTVQTMQTQIKRHRTPRLIRVDTILPFPTICSFGQISMGIRHGFSCINIRQVPREVLKTETWQMFMH